MSLVPCMVPETQGIYEMTSAKNVTEAIRQKGK